MNIPRFNALLESEQIRVKSNCLKFDSEYARTKRELGSCPGLSTRGPSLEHRQRTHWLGRVDSCLLECHGHHRPRSFDPITLLYDPYLQHRSPASQTASKTHRCNKGALRGVVLIPHTTRNRHPQSSRRQHDYSRRKRIHLHPAKARCGQPGDHNRVSMNRHDLHTSSQPTQTPDSINRATQTRLSR